MYAWAPTATAAVARGGQRLFASDWKRAARGATVDGMNTDKDRNGELARGTTGGATPKKVWRKPSVQRIELRVTASNIAAGGDATRNS